MVPLPSSEAEAFAVNCASAIGLGWCLGCVFDRDSGGALAHLVSLCRINMVLTSAVGWKAAPDGRFRRVALLAWQSKALTSYRRGVSFALRRFEISLQGAL